MRVRKLGFVDEQAPAVMETKSEGPLQVRDEELGKGECIPAPDWRPQSSHRTRVAKCKKSELE